MPSPRPWFSAAGLSPAHAQVNRRVVSILAGAFTVLCAVAVLVFVLEPDPVGGALPRWKFYTAITLPFGFAWWSARREQADRAFKLVLATTGLAAMLPPFALHLGIHAPVLMFGIVSVALTGLVCGRREAWVLAGLFAAFATLLWHGERAGWLMVRVPPALGDPTPRWATLVLAYLAAAWIVGSFSDTLRQALEDALASAARAEAAQRDSERQREWLRFIADATPALISYWDADLACRFRNVTADHYLGLGRPDSAPDDARHAVPLRRALAGETVEITVTLELPDGARTVLLRYLPDRRPDARGVLCVGWDITELSRMEQALTERTQQAEAANRAKSAFLAAISHELRTPLNGVLGMGQLLAMPALDDAERRQFANDLLTSAHGLRGLTDRILDYVELTSSTVALTSTPFDIAALLDEAALSLAARASAKGLSLRTACAEQARRLAQGDPKRLRQVIDLLADNAIKFTDRGEVVLEASALDSERIEFAVRDTGIGIAAEHLPRLFDRFAQLDGSATRRHDGVGLGLALVAAIAARLAGELGVDSTPGQGSRFWLRVKLPRAE